MDFNQHIKTGLLNFPLKTMEKSEKFLAVSAFVAKGSNKEIKLSDVKKRGVWNKRILGFSFEYRYYQKAVEKGWVAPAKKQGFFVIKDYNHLSELLGELDSKEIKKSGKLVLFSSKAANTFDLYIKKILKSAKFRVFIADSFVSDVLFDDLFTKISKEITVKMVCGKIENLEAFNRKCSRFKTEWKKFNIKKSITIHDRFMVVDHTGYLLGPSLKDAADNYPSLLMALSLDETKLLSDFFNELWKNSKLA